MAEKNEKKSRLDRKKKITGIVIKKSGNKTVKVEVEKWTYHALYKKRIKLKKSYLIHDEKNETSIGDKILVAEHRPLSHTKRWNLVKIVEKAK